MMRVVAFCLGIAATLSLTMLLTPASAQDVSVPDTTGDYSSSLLTRRLSDQAMNQQNRRGGGSQSIANARTRATCANKRRAAANLGRNNPDVRHFMPFALRRACKSLAFGNNSRWWQ